MLFGSDAGGYGTAIGAVIYLMVSAIRPTQATPAAPAPPTEPPAPAGDPVRQLGELADLRDNGTITSDEFEAKKTELLKRV